MTMSPTSRISHLLVPGEDLQRCHELLGPAAWQSLAGQKIFMTGGTGFVGKWLLATLLDADAAFNLDCRITVLSRNPASFVKDWPAMAGRVAWITGDVRDFRIGSERQDVIIHAATDVAAQPSPQEVFDTCLEGTRQVLALARTSGARRLLLLSSGAVYGPLPPGMTHVPETHLGAPDPLSVASAYGEGKRVSELLVAQAGLNGLDVHIARLFAAVGPHLPLDKHFAVGNFINAAMKGEAILVGGDGTPFRSYIYAADMAAWLWAVLIRGQSGRAYNIGAEESLSILALAHRVAEVLKAKVDVRRTCALLPDHAPQHYVPLTRRAITELSLSTPLGLNDALRRTARWYVERAHS
jgi:nucleoside-diphosphate-sugar epimerase